MKKPTHFVSKPMHFVSDAERSMFQKRRDAVLAADRANPRKPKLRCRLFGHDWYTHRLAPGSRTICWRCKVTPITPTSSEES